MTNTQFNKLVKRAERYYSVKFISDYDGGLRELRYDPWAREYKWSLWRAIDEGDVRWWNCVGTSMKGEYWRSILVD